VLFQANVNKMGDTVKEKQAFLEVRQPEFDELEKKFAENTSDFDFTKKNVVGRYH
jgi:hypothetical protein